jgi:hypothetical protein
MGYYDDWVEPNAFFRTAKRIGGRSKTMLSNHAGMRLTERYPDVDRELFCAAIKAGTFEYVKKQTGTRTICKAVIGRDEVWFIWSKTEKVIVTVLTPEQAQDVSL